MVTMVTSFTHHSPQHCDYNSSCKTPNLALAKKSHDDIEENQDSEWEVTPVGREEDRTMSHHRVWYVGTRQLELSKEHEEEDQVDGNSEEVDKLRTAKETCKLTRHAALLIIYANP